MQVRKYSWALVALILGFPAAGFAQTDDVVVDGRIITGENPRSAATGKGPTFSAFDQPYRGGVRVAVGDVDGGCAASCSNNLSPAGDPQAQGGRHPGGVNVTMGDGSVRFLKSTTDAGGAYAPKTGSLGSLNGVGSIGQIANPTGTPTMRGQNNIKQLGLAAHNANDAGNGSEGTDGTIGSQPGPQANGSNPPPPPPPPRPPAAPLPVLLVIADQQDFNRPGPGGAIDTAIPKMQFQSPGAGPAGAAGPGNAAALKGASIRKN